MYFTTFSMTPDSLAFGNTYMHPALREMMPSYCKLRDCLENKVKEKAEEYLPDPSEAREDPTLKAKRYKHYVQRATWLPVTSRTRQGLVAQVFTRPPAVKGADSFKEFLSRVTGNGDTLSSFMHYGFGEVTAMGRGAIVVLDVDNGKKPLLDFAETENIITWSELPTGRTDSLGRNLGGVLIRSFYTQTADDLLTVQTVVKLTHYVLDDNDKVWVRTCTSLNQQWSGWVLLTVHGQFYDYIPVFPVGAERNNLTIQTPPLDELADLNISHFTNSADYEEHIKLTGQATLVINGLTQEWFDANIDGKVALGVRRPMPLEKDSDAKLLQAVGNSGAKEALDKKEQQMVSVGARLIEQRQVRRTATEADIESQSYHSILGHMAQNMSAAMTEALRHCSRYFNNGVVMTDAMVQLNDDFSSVSTNAEHRRLLLEEYLAGAISYSEYRVALRRYNTGLLDDSAAKKEIEADIDFREKIATIGKSTTDGAASTAPKGSDNRTKQPTE